MFRPVRLTRVTIQTPEEHISSVMAVLGDLRLLHLIRAEETHLGRMGYLAHVDTSLLARYDVLLNKVNRLRAELAPQAPSPGITKAPRPDKAIFQLEESLAAIEKESSAPLEKRKNIVNHLAENQAVIERLQLLAGSDLDLDRLHGLKYVAWHAGLIPKENLERLEMSLDAIQHSLIPLQKREERIVLLAFVLREDEQTLLRALKSSFWDPLQLPEDLHGSVAGILEQLDTANTQQKDQLTELEKERGRLAEKYGAKLLRMREEILLARELLKAQEKFGQIDHSYLLTGWLPLSLFDTLQKRIMEATSGKALIEKIDPNEVKEVRSGTVSIPILFNNPALIRPFERLTTLYGTPSYEEMEPTGFLAITFLLLFGMMFGDVGHGGVLCIVGYIIFKKMIRYLDYGIILMECGVSAMIFGLLYGSIFGLENFLPALWMHPMENIAQFMRISAGLGVLIISTGLILNIVNMARQHRYTDLFSASGLAGALFYWLLCALAVRYFLAGPLSSYEILFSQLAGITLFLLMFLQKTIRYFLAGVKKKNGKRDVPAGVGITVLESFVEVLDELLRYLANTVSFVRVAAFGLAHAGLFMAVFSLADMVRNAHGGGIFYWLTLLVGNCIIIGLEGLVVSIQTIRLEYYEFFSKFFQGGGKAFQPMFTKKE